MFLISDALPLLSSPLFLPVHSLSSANCSALHQFCYLVFRRLHLSIPRCAVCLIRGHPSSRRFIHHLFPCSVSAFSSHTACIYALRIERPPCTYTAAHNICPLHLCSLAPSLLLFRTSTLSSSCNRPEPCSGTHPTTGSSRCAPHIQENT